MKGLSEDVQRLRVCNGAFALQHRAVMSGQGLTPVTIRTVVRRCLCDTPLGQVRVSPQATRCMCSASWKACLQSPSMACMRMLSLIRKAV
jgi:hypothetical protein